MKKIAVISGGAGGIGQACVQKMKEDYQVIILDINEQAVQECQKKYQVDGYVIDLCDVNSIRHIVHCIKEKYQQINVLVQTAGWMHSQLALEVQEDTFDKMMKINVQGMFFLMQEVVRTCMINTGGVILNFASEAALRGFQGKMASVHYSASKGAVIAMSRQLAVEWGPYHIRVNSISPGGVMTPAMKELDFQEDFSNIPLRRLSDVEDIANVVGFLCSDQAQMITGQNIVVDGGCVAVGI